jgi:hypothetical protein
MPVIYFGLILDSRHEFYRFSGVSCCRKLKRNFRKIKYLVTNTTMLGCKYEYQIRNATQWPNPNMWTK